MVPPVFKTCSEIRLSYAVLFQAEIEMFEFKITRDHAVAAKSADSVGTLSSRSRPSRKSLRRSVRLRSRHQSGRRPDIPSSSTFANAANRPVRVAKRDREFEALFLPQ